MGINSTLPTLLTALNVIGLNERISSHKNKLFLLTVFYCGRASSPREANRKLRKIFHDVKMVEIHEGVAHPSKT